MAEGRCRRIAFQVHLDYTFDRLRDPKLAQVYEILVPARERKIQGVMVSLIRKQERRKRH